MGFVLRTRVIRMVTDANAIFGGVVSYRCLWLNDTGFLMTILDMIMKAIYLFIGEKCNRRIKNIPFKPLSERMLEEPFWLGLIAVTCVMTTIGICYLFKKHLPDKFDKMLTPSVDQLKNPTTEGQTGKLRWTLNKSKWIISNLTPAHSSIGLIVVVYRFAVFIAIS